MNIRTSINARVSRDGNTDASMNTGRKRNIDSNTDMNVIQVCVTSFNTIQILIQAVHG